MTRSIVEEWGLLVKWPSKNDAHRWRRSDDRRTMRPTGRGEYGNNRVQEIVSGTHRTTCRRRSLVIPVIGLSICSKDLIAAGQNRECLRTTTQENSDGK